MTDIVERLRHAFTTASNDDLSKPGTEARERHCARLDAMQEAAAEIARLRAGAGEPVGWMVMLPGFGPVYFHDKVDADHQMNEPDAAGSVLTPLFAAPPAPALPSVDAVAKELYYCKPREQLWAALPDEFRRQYTKRAERVLALFHAPAEKEPT